MLTHPTLDKLKALKLTGMAVALHEQLQQSHAESLSFDERSALMVEAESILRENRRLASRLSKAKLKQAACVENIDYQTSRGLDKRLVLELAQCYWLKQRCNVLIVGPTGTGKTYLGCALAHKACLYGFSSSYMRMTRLMPHLQIARGDGSYNKLMSQLAKIQLLVLDDWGLLTLNQEQQRDLLELLDDRHEKTSTIVTSQLPIKLWHESIGDDTLADAILDRLLHNAYRIELKGASMRKLKANLTDKTEKE